jgi:hypothetical protein
MIWWHATGTRNPDEPHAPRMNGVGAWYNASVPLSAGGQQLYNAGQSKPTFPKPAVDLRASGCASTR